MSKYPKNPEVVINKLVRNGVSVDEKFKMITPTGTCGLGCWGAIDFLCHYHDYKLRNMQRIGAREQ